MACLFPFGIRSANLSPTKGPLWVNVPCGTCPECLKAKSNAWLVRLLEEDKISSLAYFVTLTYDEAHVPKSPSGKLTLRKADFQNFIKRLRKISGRIIESRNGFNCIGSVRYYACGEYGSKFSRPHYHAIIFNATEKNIRRSWELALQTIGDVDVVPSNPSTMQYTLKYLHKGQTVKKGDDRLREFALMSKGIGKSYLTPQKVAYHLADKERFYATLPGGTKVALPRYLKTRIYNSEDCAAYAKLIAKTSDFQEAKRFLDSGMSPDEYRQSKYESKKSATINFKNKSKR